MTRTSTRPGILGSSIIQKRVTDFLDVRAATREVHAEMAADAREAA